MFKVAWDNRKKWRIRKLCRNASGIIALDDFRLPSSFFKIQTADKVVARTEDMNKHLENIEQCLTRVLGDNFKQFNQAFESFSLVDHDLL